MSGGISKWHDGQYYCHLGGRGQAFSQTHIGQCSLVNYHPFHWMSVVLELTNPCLWVHIFPSFMKWKQKRWGGRDEIWVQCASNHRKLIQSASPTWYTSKLSPSVTGKGTYRGTQQREEEEAPQDLWQRPPFSISLIFVHSSGGVLTEAVGFKAIFQIVTFTFLCIPILCSDTICTHTNGWLYVSKWLSRI